MCQRKVGRDRQAAIEAMESTFKRFSRRYLQDPALGFPGGSDGKESACNTGDLVKSLGREDPLENGMATHSSIPAWRIPWTEEPGRLQSVGRKESDTIE